MPQTLPALPALPALPTREEYIQECEARALRQLCEAVTQELGEMPDAVKDMVLAEHNASQDACGATEHYSKQYDKLVEAHALLSADH